jgi:membrane-bound serine protease (ClpP class)
VSLAHALAELSPGVALGVFTVGLLLIYVELNRPGRVIPGALGLLLALLACARIGAEHPRPVALLLLATAAALLVLELVRDTHVAVSVAAALALVLGFREMVTPSPGWMVCILCGVVLGGATAVLTRVARRARTNKAARQRGEIVGKSGEPGEAPKL